MFTAGIDGKVFARHGTSVETRLLVFDKQPAEDAQSFVSSVGMAPDEATLMGWIAEHVPARLPSSGSMPARSAPPVTAPTLRTKKQPAPKPALTPEGLPLAYDVAPEPVSDSKISDAIYEPYRLQSITIPGAQAHPSPLVQSASMASVTPPRPSYRPHLPKDIHANLSAAQLETVIYAGEAHSAHLAGSWQVDETFDNISAAPEGVKDAVQFRRGFMLGDGTGAGKGRQSAGIILDNWLQGRRKALWVSKSDKLLEDAQRDWSALGMERLLVTPLSRFAQGRKIPLNEGILFTTYATLRSDTRGGNPPWRCSHSPIM